MLQARISAFESLSGPSSSSKNTAKFIPRSPPNLLESPISSAADSLPQIVPSTPPKSVSRSPSPSPPNLGRKTSLIDLKDWIVDDGPSPPRQNGFGTRTNGSPARQRIFDNKPSYNRRSPTTPLITTPLINLESPPKTRPQKAPPLPPRKPSYSSLKSVSSASSNSIPMQRSSSASLQPPRRSDSLTVEHTYPPLSNVDMSSRTSQRHAPGSSISSFHSVSLSSDGGNNTDPSTPGSVSNFIHTFPMDHENGNTNGSEADTVSLDESYENVSASSVASPTTAALMAHDWEKAMGNRRPPKLPQRPNSSKPQPPPRTPISSPPSARSAPASPKMQATSSVSSSSSSSTTTRRAPPPPPPAPRSRPPSTRTSTGTTASASASDRSSILSTATSTSRSSYGNSTRVLPNVQVKLSLLRPTPVPAAARKRYEAVFVSNVLQRRKAKSQNGRPALLSPSAAKKSRQAAGWRGLSVDLITNPDDNPVGAKEGDEDEWEEIVGPEERLDGHVVKLVWNKSKLDREKLKDIWCVVTIYNHCVGCRINKVCPASGMNVTSQAKDLWIATRLSRACGGSMKSFEEHKFDLPRLLPLVLAHFVFVNHHHHRSLDRFCDDHETLISNFTHS